MTALSRLMRSDVSEARLAILATEFASFLRAGGSITLEEWDLFSAAGRAAAIRGASIAEDARADAFAVATANVTSAALAEANAQRAVAAAADEVAAELGGVAP